MKQLVENQNDENQMIEKGETEEIYGGSGWCICNDEFRTGTCGSNFSDEDDKENVVF